jgi:hypothetical protein
MDIKTYGAVAYFSDEHALKIIKTSLKPAILIFT